MKRSHWYLGNKSTQLESIKTISSVKSSKKKILKNAAYGIVKSRK